ncbi:MAG: hypothetical protein K2H96_07040 [Muribaculaceae bacterium]|nr:hypothetical protein [Muribaculaceae bacterium]
MRKFLLSFVCLLTMALPSLAETKTYQLCTDETEILNPDNQFIIVSAKAFSNTVYAVSKGIAGVAVKSNSAVVPEELTLDAEDLQLGFFSFVDNGSYKAMLEKVSGKYVGGAGNKTNINTENSFTGTNYQLAISVAKSGEVTIISQGSTTRAFSFQKGTSFKNYATSNLTNADYAYPLFYKEVLVGPQVPKYDGFKSEYTLEIGQTLPFPAISPKELTYTFTTEDSDIIEIDEANKTFKALKDGVAVISFSTEAFEDKFNAGSGEFMIEVTKKTPKLSFSDQIVYGKLNVGVVWQELMIEDPADADRSTIEYTSSDPTIVVVDPVTGQIKPEDIKKTGEVIITAKLPGAGDYAEGSESYKILVLDPEAQIEPSTVVFDFSVKDPYGMTTQSGSNAGYETKIKEIEGDDVVTISFDGNYRSWSASGAYQLRIHKDASLTVEVPEGYKITQIGMIADKEGENMTGEFNPGGSVEEVEGDHAGDWEDVNFHWHAGDKVVGKVTYTNHGKTDKDDKRDNNDIITKLFVMYEAATSGLKSAQLSFTPTVNGIIAGEEATINAVKNPNGREVRYSLANVENTEEETLYTIEPTEDGKNLKVWVKNPGYYTLEARSDASDGFRDGFAIMRLNVFNHLDVFVDDVKIEEDIIATAGDESKVVTFEVVQPEVLNIYYRIEDKNTPAIDPDEETDDENCEPGFELYEDMIEIPANINGKLLFYVANYGYKSPIRTIILGKEETEFKAPALLGLEGEGVKIEGNDTEGYKVESDHALSLTFDYDPEDSPIMVMYTVVTMEEYMNGDESDWETYDGTAITIDKDYIFSYFALDMTSGDNFMTMKRTNPVSYMFSIDIPKPFTAPALLGLEGEGVKIEGNDTEGYMVESDHALSLTFDYDPEDSPIMVMYTVVTMEEYMNGDESDWETYDGTAITIDKDYIFSYFALDMTSGDNFMTMKRTNPVSYMFSIKPAVAPELPEFEVVGGKMDGNFINSEGVVTIKFKPVDGIHVYYKTTLKNEPAKARDCAHPDGHADFTKHDGVEEIELNATHDTFSVFACNPETDQHSDVVTYKLDVATGVSEIEAADAADTLYFDLNGFRVVNPEKGTYIRVTKGKAEKVVK